MVMMVREEVVVVLVLVVLVGVTREVLLLLNINTDQVLGLVKQRLVGGAGGVGTGVGVLLARELVGGGLGGGLVGVGDGVTVRKEGQLGFDGRGGRWREVTYRWTLSAAPVTVSFTFSVVDLELSGVTWSATSVASVSMRLHAGVENER